MDTNKELYYEFEGTKEFYQRKPYLTVSEKSAFVSFVVDSVVGNHYLPLFKDILFGYALVKYLTDIDMSRLVSWSNESHDYLLNLDMVELFLRETGITADLIELYPALVDELRENVDDAIAYKTGIRKSGLTFEFERLIRGLNDILSDLELKDIPWDKILSRPGKEDEENEEDYDDGQNE